MAGYLTIMLLVLSFGAYVAFELNRLAHITHLAAGLDSDVIQLTESLSTRLRILVSIEKKYWISRDADFYRLFGKRQNEFIEQLNSLAPLIYATEARASLQTALTVGNAYFSQVKNREKNAGSEPAATYEAKRDDSIQALLQALDRIEQISNLARYEKIQQAESISTKVQWLTIAFGLICIVTSLAVSLLTTRRIVRPIVLFQRKTREVAAGSFTRIEELRAPVEIRHLAEEFNSMIDRLQELDRLKEDYVSHLSHTLRTPLTAIQEASEMLAKGIFDDDPGSYSQLVTIIRDECRRLIVSVNRILDLSRMESRMMEYHFVKTDLNELITTALTRLSPLAKAKKVRMFFEPRADLPLVLADSDQLHQLLDNLIGNALKYTEPGGAITLKAEPPAAAGAAVLISVTDSGCGMEPQDLQHIFDRFRRIEHGRDTARGSGLGLAIAQHIVKAHGGTLWVESRKGQGSTFYFSLPPA